ncbi:NAD-dependent epimerase [Sediminicola sp. YIK13]|uniref:TIGR01777 family oxidoreductase n=1 Tax=Sediminicola sp. YIK13 TaxID=1453352 RepID=UPI00071F8DD0|nr:TIGR01777 family oxidoreductase [Sediminicola sp. YIK13]ALM07641.1 NAD-dependent epimerase [Sediminicola sp. YIK13]
MKILITGATGLVGSAIVELCHKKNIDVNYLSTSKSKIVSNPNYKGFYWNPAKGEIDLECFEGVTSIINLAGVSISKRWTESNKQAILNSRINSLKTLRTGVDSVDSSKIESFVSASAIGIYPDSLSSYYSEEEEAVDDSFLGSVVQAWEKEADTFNKFNFSVAKIRIGLVLSAKGGALPEMAKPINNYVGAAFGTGDQWQSWIHINDLSRMFLFVANNKLQGVFNGVAPNPVCNNKLIKEIAKQLKKPLILPNIPEFPMKLILGEMSYILFASQRVSSKKMEEEGFNFHYPNICKALKGIYSEATKVKQESPVSQTEFMS